jgi:DNA-directed RNA polymerase specialized sigma24 family protein
LNDCSPIASGVSDAAVVAAINAVSKKLARAFSFGNYTPQDIAQEVAAYSLELLRKGGYDPSRSLEAYLTTHARNRLCNLRRNLHHRSDSPCPRCAAGTFCCDPGPCQKHSTWAARNLAKATLGRTAELVAEPPDKESAVEARAEANELEDVLNTRIPVELRHDYLLLRSGQALPKVRRKRVQEAVLAAMKAAGLGLEDFGL